MLGHLFYKFNQGVLCVAGLWLAYTIFQLLMSSVEGQFQQKKPHIILLRVALGIALIIPNPTTGYSAIQDILMKVIVEGVSLANMVWSEGLTYLQAGEPIWHQPDASANNQPAQFGPIYTQIVGDPSKWSADCVFGSACNQPSSNAGAIASDSNKWDTTTIN